MANGLIFSLGEEAPVPPEDSDFSFTIDFKKGEGDPRRVFDAASSLIDGLEGIDEAVATSVDAKLKTLMVLEDVEAGSLRVFLKNILKRVDDDALKSLEWKKAVGAALVKAKYVAIQYLNQDQSFASSALDHLREEMRSIAQETDVRHLPDYAPIHEGRLISSLDKIQDAKRMLGQGDTLTVDLDGSRYEVDLAKTWSPRDFVRDVPQTKETHSEGEVILGIRKPDLLGESMWQFSHGRATISAKVTDDTWLKKFHTRQVPLYSGDSLRCKVIFTYVYDERGELLEQKTEIIEVLEVLPANAQQSGFDF
ncbi:hypothetical protein [Afipia sp. Root123D2]|uniref:hypothetical protein n=1 Tax=Afipia sp. Root123D2 TaxID=1736436 RepID=UPI000A9F67CF|nr:hypothetical protein [Afipia sp. Root123D2]